MRRLLVPLVFIVCLWSQVCAQSAAADEAQTWDVAVIGAGGGGLAAAATLSQAGLKVILLEQHVKVGGYMTAFERGDYRFEVSLHAISGFTDEIGAAKPLFRELGVLDKVQPLRIDVPYRVVFPDFEMDVPANVNLYHSRLTSRFPDEKEGIDRLFKMMDNVRFVLQARAGKAGPPPDERPGWPFQKYSRVSARVMLADFIQDPKLLALFSWLRMYCGTGLDELPATLLLGMWGTYHYDGYYYISGGSQAISNALAEVITGNGSRIELSTLVTGIVIQDGRAVAVRTRDGREFRCRFVVSNASGPATINELVGRERFPEEYLAPLDKMEIGPSILQVYLGVNHDYRPEFRGAHGITLLETSDLAEEERAFRDGDLEKVPFIIVNYSGMDPGAAPTGKNVLTFTTYMPYEWREGWYEGESYEKYAVLKKEAAEVLIHRAEKVLPELGSHIEVMEVGSPRTMEHFTLNPKGAVYGWSLKMSNPAPQRLAQETPIPNLFLAGVWTTSGHGQLAALGSGSLAARLILDREKAR